MPLFVHVQAQKGVTATQVEHTWGSTAEPVANGPIGLFVVMVDAFGEASEVAPSFSTHVASLMTALKRTFGTTEVASISTFEFELLSRELLINVMVRKQGLLLTTKDGIVAAAGWPATLTPESIAATVQQAADTLAVARELHSSAQPQRTL